MKSTLTYLLAALPASQGLSNGLEDVDWAATAQDLNSYITRPDLRPMRLNITTHKQDLVSPGYFFISPFDRNRELAPHHTFVPGQVGPHIYDEEGNLVWSGAYAFDQRNAYDFEATTYKGKPALSFAIWKSGDIANGPNTQACTGIVLDSSYQIVGKAIANDGSREINMHEFRLVDDGKHALVILNEGEHTKDTAPNGKVWTEDYENNSFQEVEVETGKTMFKWFAHDHIPIGLSTAFQFKGRRADPYHMNSVDKTADGHYLVSMRHMSAVYLISGKDGSIIWQIGGEKDSFVHTDDFVFNWQHHARVYERNETHTLVSFLDNASNEAIRDKDPGSSALLVALSTATTPMTATEVRRWKRPDDGLSYRRGAVTIMPNHNAFVAWGEQGYTSEFAWDGELVQEVRYADARFDDYRAFKMDFEGYSNEPIAVVSRVYGASAETLSTIIHVSWNGATEVAGWNFYRSESKQGKAKKTLLGYQDRTGFETAFITPGFQELVFAEAVGKDGKVMSNSSVETTTPPVDFSEEQIDELKAMTGHDSDNGPQPDIPLPSWMCGAIGLVIGVAAAYLAFWLRSRRQKRDVSWSRIPETEDAAEAEEAGKGA